MNLFSLVKITNVENQILYDVESYTSKKKALEEMDECLIHDFKLNVNQIDSALIKMEYFGPNNTAIFIIENKLYNLCLSDDCKNVADNQDGLCLDCAYNTLSDLA